ncbi:hypothetical protein D3C78_1540670 [compost metagenome]
MMGEKYRSNRFDAVSLCPTVRPPGPLSLESTLVQTYGKVKLDAKFQRPGPVSQVLSTVANVNATCPSSPSDVRPPTGTSRLPPILPSR